MMDEIQLNAGPVKRRPFATSNSDDEVYLLFDQEM